MTMSRSPRRAGRLAGARLWVSVLVAAVALTGCTDEEDPTDAGAGATPGAAEWPRTIEHSSGTTEIPAQPARIVSTSVTLTGTLLAIDAPLVATAATSPSPLTDDKGFFVQWASVADERGVEVLYPNLELDLEAVELAEPDLIVASSIGQDATVEAYDQLSEIAPTVVIDYGAMTWQEIAALLGEATGLERNATALLDEYESLLATAAERIELPPQPVAIGVYNGADGVNVFSPTSSQADVLTGLGFTYDGGDTALAAQTRSDVSTYTPENAAVALADVQTVLLVPVGGDAVDAFLADPLLANHPAVAAQRVYSVPATAFRIDYHSARQLVEALVDRFGS